MSADDDDAVKGRSVHVENVSKGAPVWCIGWLFTIGFADLSFGKGLLALLIWPVYLGDALGA